MTMDTPQTSPNSGDPTHSEEARNGTLSEGSKRQLREAFMRAISSQPPEDMPRSLGTRAPSRSSSPMPRPGLSEDVGNQSKTKRMPIDNLPALSRLDRRQQNLQCERWRTGFGQLMVAASSAFNRAFGKVDLDLWASALCEYDLEDLTEGFSDFIKSPEGFPTPGKAESYIKKCRQRRLGIVVR